MQHHQHHHAGSAKSSKAGPSGGAHVAHTGHVQLCTSIFVFSNAGRNETLESSVIGTLDAFFRIPWLSHCICSVVDKGILTELEVSTLTELKSVFTARAKKADSTVPVDDFASLLNQYSQYLGKGPLLGLGSTFTCLLHLMTIGFPTMRALATENAIYNSVEELVAGATKPTGGVATTGPKKIAPFLLIASAQCGVQTPELVDLAHLFGTSVEYTLKTSTVEYAAATSGTPSAVTRVIHRGDGSNLLWYEHRSTGAPQYLGQNLAEAQEKTAIAGSSKTYQILLYTKLTPAPKTGGSSASKPKSGTAGVGDTGPAMKKKRSAGAMKRDEDHAESGGSAAADLPFLVDVDSEARDERALQNEENSDNEYSSDMAMDEDAEQDSEYNSDEYDDDGDGSTGGEDDDEEGLGDEDDDDVALDASGNVCQCPTCASERDRKREQAVKTRELEKRLHAAKKQVVLGTGTTRYTKTVLPEAQRKMKDGVLMYRDNYLVSITAMNIYNHKCSEELRWEDYFLKSNELKVVRNHLSSELADRERERGEDKVMEKEEQAMRAWTSAAAEAWTKYQRGLEVYERGTAEARASAGEHFSLALLSCISGPHAVHCFYHRALCNRTENPSQAMSDCRVVLNMKKEQGHPQAHFLLGTLMLANPQHDNENQYEKAQYHLEQALEKDPSIFEGQPERLADLQLARDKAAHQRLVNAAEEKKNLGNTALQKGAYAEAEALYSAAFQICPNGEKSYIYLCNRATAKSEMAVRKANKTEEFDTLQSAIADCEASLAMNGSYTKALFRRAFCQGMCKFLRDDYHGALECYQEALDFDKNNAFVKTEVKRVSSMIDAIKAREAAKALEKEMAEKDALKAEARERERRLLDEKRAKEEQARKEKAEKVAQEKAEQAALKKEREAAKAEKDKELAAEKERDKERLKAEKEAEKIAREQEKIEERERRKAERETERERARIEKERSEKAYLEKEREKREREEEFAREMSRVSERIKETEKSPSVPTPSATSSILAAVGAVSSLSAGQQEKSKEANKSAVAGIGSAVAAMGPKVDRNKTPESPASSKSAPASSAALASASAAAALAASKSLTSFYECPEERVGVVIGSKGSVINSIIKKTGCNMHVDLEGRGNKRVVMTGTAEQIEMGKRYVQAVIVHGPSVLTLPTLPPVETAPFKAEGSMARSLSTSSPSLPSFSFDSNESDCCLICAEPMKEGSDRMPCFGQCNHRGACSICLMRMRAIEPKDLHCPMCRQKNEHVICSFDTKMWKEFKLPGSVPPGIRFHRESQMYFPISYYSRFIDPLWLQQCKMCSLTFKDGDLLGKHYQAAHNMRLCAMCVQHKQVFPSEQIVYTPAELDSHMKHRGKDGSEGHPRCSFCNVDFYDKNTLFKHVQADHFWCNFCPNNEATTSYYRDYRMLETHYRESHFACEDPACVEKKHVVFKSLFDLQAHNRAAHGSKKAANDGVAEDNLPAFPALGGGSGSGSSGSLSRTTSAVSGPPMPAVSMQQLEQAALSAAPSRTGPPGSAGDSSSFFGSSSNAGSLGAGLGLGLSSLGGRLGTSALSEAAEQSYGFDLGLGFSSLGLDVSKGQADESSAVLASLLSRPAGAGRDLTGLFGGGSGGFGAAESSQFGSSSFFDGFGSLGSDVGGGMGGVGGGGLGGGNGQAGFESESTLMQRLMGDGMLGINSGTGTSSLFPGLSSSNSEGVGLDTLGSSGAYDGGNFAPLTIDRIIQLLKIFGSEGILGSALPELYHKRYNEKLRMDTKFGKRVKLLDMVEGHPNVRLTGEKSGSMKLYYSEVGAGKGVGKGAATASGQPAALLSAAFSGGVGGVGGNGAGSFQAAAAPEPAPQPYSEDPGIEVDLLPLSEARLHFDALTWLRDYDMAVYRWAGIPDKEWTEFALRLRPDVTETFESATSSAHVSALAAASGCEMSVEREKLYGREEKFLRFVRGISGAPTNAAMSTALQIVSNVLHLHLECGLDDSDDDGGIGEGELMEADGEVPPLGMLDGPGRVQRVLDIPPSAVGHVYGKNGKKLQLMRKKSGAYITLVPMKSMKGKGPAKLTISGSLASVDLVVRMVKAALVGTGDAGLSLA